MYGADVGPEGCMYAADVDRPEGCMYGADVGPEGFMYTAGLPPDCCIP